MAKPLSLKNPQRNSEDGVWAEVDLSQNLATVHMKNNLSELFLRKLVSSAGYIMTTYNVQ